MGVRILASLTAILGSTALTLGCLIAVVRGTILAVSIDKAPLRFLAVAADFALGTIALLGCIFLATHLAVRILGVGQTDFPAMHLGTDSSNVSSEDPAKI